MHVQVLFSSVAALLGSPGQSSYAAANGKLDALASAWQRKGTPGTAIQWGPWADVGMAASSAGLATRARQWGLGMVSPEQGLAALCAALAPQSAAASSGIIIAARIDWQQFLQQQLRHGHDNGSMVEEFDLDTKPAVIAEAAQDRTRSVAQPDPAHAEEAPTMTLQRMQALVQATVSNLLGSEVSGSRPLMAAGMLAIHATHDVDTATENMLNGCCCHIVCCSSLAP